MQFSVHSSYALLYSNHEKLDMSLNMPESRVTSEIKTRREIMQHSVTMNPGTDFITKI